MLEGVFWQGVGVAGGARVAVCDPRGTSLWGFFAAHTTGLQLDIFRHVGLGTLSRNWCWGSAHPAHGYRLVAADPKSEA